MNNIDWIVAKSGRTAPAFKGFICIVGPPHAIGRSAGKPTSWEPADPDAAMAFWAKAHPALPPLTRSAAEGMRCAWMATVLPRCTCSAKCGKLAYETRFDAARAAEWMNTLAAAVGEAVVSTEYRCSNDGGLWNSETRRNVEIWHLTTT